METNDYEKTAAPIDFTPRLRASQETAARKRAQQAEPAAERPASLPARSYRLPAAAAVSLIILMVAAASYQLARLPAALPLQIPATIAPSVPTAAPAPRPTIAPATALPAPTAAPEPELPPQAGQGLTLSQDSAEAPPAAPEQPAPPVEQPATGEKHAPDRAARHAAAVARDRQTHGEKVP